MLVIVWASVETIFVLKGDVSRRPVKFKVSCDLYTIYTTLTVNAYCDPEPMYPHIKCHDSIREQSTIAQYLLHAIITGHTMKLIW